MKFKFNDGGRAAAGYKGTTGDCVVRSIAIASGLPYQEVYDELNRRSKIFNTKKRTKLRGKSDSRTGVHKEVYHRYILDIGGVWEPLIKIGTGCKVHLNDKEIDVSAGWLSELQNTSQRLLMAF